MPLSARRHTSTQETDVDDLTWTLKQLCRRNLDGSFATQADRQRSLTLMARQLRDAGFNQ